MKKGKQYKNGETINGNTRRSQADIVNLLLDAKDKHLTAAQVAAEQGVKKGTIYYWQSKYKADLTPNGHKPESEKVLTRAETIATMAEIQQRIDNLKMTIDQYEAEIHALAQTL